jgi:hypothetical protein
MNRIAHGIIHGNTIELNNNPGFQDGQELEIFMKTVDKNRPESDSIPKSPGAKALVWTEQDDKILEELYRQRKCDTGREIPE